MRIRIAGTLVVFVVMTLVPTLQAQRRSGSGGPASQAGPGGRMDAPRSSDTPPVRTDSPRPDTRRVTTTNTPSSPIPPITNPVAPITNPIQPIIRYGVGGTPTVVIQSNVPGRTTSGAPIPQSDRRRGQGARNVVVVGGAYLTPDYLYYGQPYYEPYANPDPIPGQLPGTYPTAEQSAVYTNAPPANAVPSPAPSVDAPIFYPDQNSIITPPEPARTLEPPAIGTSRAEVLNRYGQPWGSIATRGKETLYFKGLTLVLEDGKVSQVR